MAISVADWYERDLDRQSARQRNQVETAKLLATFSVSAAAAVTAAALQEARSRSWDVVCIVLLAVAFVLVLVVVTVDRMVAVDRDSLFVEARHRGWSDEQLFLELNIALTAAVRNNEYVATAVKRATFAQVMVAFLAAASGTISLLNI